VGWNHSSWSRDVPGMEARWPDLVFFDWDPKRSMGGRMSMRLDRRALLCDLGPGRINSKSGGAVHLPQAHVARAASKVATAV
jgi:hypothetical protein